MSETSEIERAETIELREPLPPDAGGSVGGNEFEIAAPPPLSLPDRALCLPVPAESRTERIGWLIVMLAILAMYAYSLACFWAPADGGVDQNAYLMGGKQLAFTGSTRLAPANPFAFVGHMFVLPEGNGGGYYPKYPVGLSLLFATMIWTAGWTKAATLAFAVSPVSAVAAVAGLFFLSRAVAGSFAAVLAAILLASCPVMWDLANVANSHAACIAFVVWGMYALLRWWQTGTIWRGLLAGALLGYACLIRYTEGLLVIPILVAVAFRLHWRDWRSYLRNAAPLLGWAVPVIVQLAFNRFTIGDWTGYDSSNESEFGKAFSLAKFVVTWEQMLRTFHGQGLFFTMPLGVAGLIMLFGRSWRLGIVMLAWLLPGTALYTSYYWSPDMGVAYARFFLTFFPALLVGFAVCTRYGILGGDSGHAGGGRSRALPLAAGAVVAIAAGVGTWRVVQPSNGPGNFGQSLTSQFRNRLSLATAGKILRSTVPKDSVVFADEGRMILGPANYLQFAGDWEMYGLEAFQNRGLRLAMRMGNINQDNPTPMQPRRRAAMAELYKDKGTQDLIDEQNHITDDALREGRRVFAFGTAANIDAFKRKFLPLDRYEVKTLQRWRDVPESGGGSRNTADMPRRGGGLGGMFGGPGPGPGGGPGGRFPPPPGGSPGQLNEWALIEIRHKSSPF